MLGLSQLWLFFNLLSSLACLFQASVTTSPLTVTVAQPSSTVSLPTATSEQVAGVTTTNDVSETIIR